MSQSTMKSDNDTNEDEQLIENASKLLVKLLRYEPDEYQISLNDRGWANAKTVRKIFAQELDLDWNQFTDNILQSVLESDNENRFQLQQGDEKSYNFIRATRGHDTESVSLYEIDPDPEDLSWYLAECGRHSAYVEATDEESALKVLQQNDSVSWFNESDVSIEPCDEPTITRGSTTDDLSNGPYQAYFQSARKPLRVEKRANQGGDKGRYITYQPNNVSDRLPEDVSQTYSSVFTNN